MKDSILLENLLSNNSIIPKQILITGGAGFIGSYLVKKFIDLSFVVHVLDDLSTGKLENLPIHQNIVFHKGSVLEKNNLAKFENVDMVIHLASIVGMKLAKKNQSLTYQIATEGTQNVLDSTGNAPAILLSSSAVYGLTQSLEFVNEKIKITEEQLLDYDGGEFGYAKGKYDLEKICDNFSKNGRRILIIRPFNIIGSRQVSSYGMVVPTFISQALNNAPLIVYGDGNQSRCFSSVETFTNCIMDLVKCEDVWNHGSNIINLGTDNPTSINYLAQTILSKTNSKSIIQHVPFNKIFEGHTDVMMRIPDTKYCELLLGKVDWPTIEVMIEKYINKQ